VAVNTAGAISSNKNPPQVEADNLSRLSNREEKYSYDRNLESIKANFIKSFIYNNNFKSYISAWVYYLLLTSLISAPLIILYISILNPKLYRQKYA
jgi:hypothetical protein